MIIEPLLKFLHYPDFKRSSRSIGNIHPREVDYLLEIEKERILVEAESLNGQLFKTKGHGIEQLTWNRDKKSLRAHLGIATNWSS
ncbi:MAG: hypothetical protein WA667_17850 [Candidatus Nitrosopolaris sp.]